MEINLKKEIQAGKIFIYPTDTIYGLGCDTTNEKAVQKIREIKARDKDKPLSIIAPSIAWINEHLIIDVNLKRYLPGPYTIILKKKTLKFLEHVSKETLGVRIPKSKFCDKIRETGIPFITTSVNLSGEPFAVKLEDISEEIKKQVDYIIPSEEELTGKPSTIIINGKEIERK